MAASLPNTTEDENAEKTAAVFAGSMGSLAVVLNLLTIAVIVVQRHSLTRANQLIGNLALSDFCTGCAILAFSGVLRDKSVVEDEQACAALYSVLLFGTCASVNALLLVTMDRYLIIVYPLKYEGITSNPRREVAVVIGWLVAIISAFLPALNIFGRKRKTEPCQLSTVLTKQYIIFMLFVAYLIPLFVMLMLYLRIAFVARKHQLQIQSLQVAISHQPGTTVAPHHEGQSSRREVDNSEIIQQKARSKEQWKATRTIFIVLGYFIISWVPFYILMILMSMGGNKSM